MLAEIQAGLATPVSGVRWLTEVVWDEPYTGPIPLLVETGAVPVVEAAEPTTVEPADAAEPSAPAGSIWDALDETQGLPILSRAALWRRDAVERRNALRDERGAISA